MTTWELTDQVLGERATPPVLKSTGPGLNTWPKAGVDVTINTDQVFGRNRDEVLNPFNPFIAIDARRRARRVRTDARAG